MAKFLHLKVSKRHFKYFTLQTCWINFHEYRGAAVSHVIEKSISVKKKPQTYHLSILSTFSPKWLNRGSSFGKLQPIHLFGLLPKYPETDQDPVGLHICQSETHYSNVIFLIPEQYYWGMDHLYQGKQGPNWWANVRRNFFVSWVFSTWQYSWL